MPKQGTERRVQTGGMPPKPFRPVDAKYRARLSTQVSAIRTAVVPQMRATGVAPVRVKLLSKAAAKSHRPENLFSHQSCPIIGAGRLGELFVKATPAGLDRLADIISNNDSERITKELSCVDAIEPVTPAYRRSGMEPADLLRRSPRGKKGFITRVRLFSMGAEAEQRNVIADFEKTCQSRDVRFSQNGYSAGSFTYQIECRDVADVEALSRVIGVRSIAPMPLIRTIRPRMFDAKPLPALPTRDQVTGDFPVVVVVDSGIAGQVPDLESWVVGRDSQVAPAYRNPDHGTFVAGLICWGGYLNPTIPGLDNSPCGVFDLQVIPNDDPAKGDTLPLLETEFLVSLEAALQQHANRYKVWNLSLAPIRCARSTSSQSSPKNWTTFKKNTRSRLLLAPGITIRRLSWISRGLQASCRLGGSRRLRIAFSASPWVPSLTSTTRKTGQKSIIRPLSPVMEPAPIM